MAAKKIDIDWTRVDKLLNAQCSGVKIAGLLGIHENTLYDRCKKDKGMEFMVYSAKKKGEGLELLKEKQYDTAMSGNVVMQIWLGKQYLGQKDRTDHTSGDDKIQPVNFTVDSEETATAAKKIINGSKPD